MHTEVLVVVLWVCSVWCPRLMAGQSCQLGFYLLNDACVDVDECEAYGDPMYITSLCGAYTVCHNTPGSYYCGCQAGYVTPSGATHFTKVTHCKESHSKHFGDLSILNISNLSVNNSQSLSEVMSFASELLSREELWNSMETGERMKSANAILTLVEKSSIAAGLDLPDRGVSRNWTEIMDVEVQMFRGEGTSEGERVRLRTRNNTMDVFRNTVTGGNATGSGAVSFISYTDLGAVLNGTEFNFGGKTRDFYLASEVISASLSHKASHTLHRTVNFTLSLKKAGDREHTPMSESKLKMFCVGWRYSENRASWSHEGCEMRENNSMHTTCECDYQRLGSFALIMAHQDMPVPYSLIIISYMGIVASLVCLAISIGMFIFWSKAKNSLTITNIQLCLSLFLALLTFLVGINQTHKPILCGIIAGLLHYWFLVAFAWMFLEGVQLCLMARDIHKCRKPIPHFHCCMYALGYGVPALIVAVSVALRSEGYGSERHCWLNDKNGLRWSFLGPVYLIIVVNFALYLTVLCILRHNVTSRSMELPKVNTRMLVLKATGQVFVLGCTWILGAFHFQKEMVVMAYLFTIVNSFQGVFIFIFLCLLKQEVRAEMGRCCATCRAKEEPNTRL